MKSLLKQSPPNDCPDQLWVSEIKPKNMNYTENNKIIADWMKVKFNDKVGQWEISESTFRKNLKYHTSWDWLMGVVEKIEALDINQFAEQLGRSDVSPIKGHFWFQRIGNNVESFASVYYWQYDNQITGLPDVKGNSPIDAMYTAILQFIKFYNETKK